MKEHFKKISIVVGGIFYVISFFALVNFFINIPIMSLQSQGWSIVFLIIFSPFILPLLTVFLITVIVISINIITSSFIKLKRNLAIVGLIGLVCIPSVLISIILNSYLPTLTNKSSILIDSQYYDSKYSFEDFPLIQETNTKMNIYSYEFGDITFKYPLGRTINQFSNYSPTGKDIQFRLETPYVRGWENNVIVGAYVTDDYIPPSDGRSKLWWLDTRDTSKEYFDIEQIFSACKNDEKCHLYKNSAGIQFAYFPQEMRDGLTYTRLVFNLGLPNLEPLQLSNYDLLKYKVTKKESEDIINAIASTLDYQKRDDKKNIEFTFSFLIAIFLPGGIKI